MRHAIIVAFAFAVVGCATRQPIQKAIPAPTLAQSLASTKTPAPNLCFVDGRESNCQGVLQMTQSRIDNVEVLRGSSAVALYGSRARDGVMVVSTKR